MGEMILKVAIALTIASVFGHRSRAGVISLKGEDFDGQQQAPLLEVFHGQQQAPLKEDFHGQQHASLASSYVQFQGPVEGPEFEVKVRRAEYHGNHLHGQQEHAVDYVAHPKYEFSYGVEDHHTGDFHEQKETRDGNSVSGQYSVKEPGGSVRVVRYHADKDGFHAVVHTSGENDHSADVCGGQGQPQIQDHQAATQQEELVQDYAEEY